MSCDPATLVDQAKCMECIPQGMQLPVLISLFCSINAASEKNFVSALFDLADADNHIVIPHGLGQVPTHVDVRTVCVVADTNLNYVPGDEIAIHSWSPSTLSAPVFTVVIDKTNVIVNANLLVQGGVGLPLVQTADGADTGTFDNIAHWKIKVYAEA